MRGFFRFINFPLKFSFKKDSSDVWAEKNPIRLDKNLSAAHLMQL
jgi:hypothetical protein